MRYDKLGERIRQQRVLANLTQERLAERAGISLSFLGHIERGSRKASLETIVNISNALKVSPSLLLQDSLESDLLGYDMHFSRPQKALLREISNCISEYAISENE